VDAPLRLEIVTVLRETLKGGLDDRKIVELMNRITRNEYKSYEAEALHQAMHFLADSDLRENDQEYDDFLRADIIAYIDKIELSTKTDNGL
jgi:hypothetical protein